MCHSHQWNDSVPRLKSCGITSTTSYTEVLLLTGNVKVVSLKKSVCHQKYIYWNNVHYLLKEDTRIHKNRNMEIVLVCKINGFCNVGQNPFSVYAIDVNA